MSIFRNECRVASYGESFTKKRKSGEIEKASAIIIIKVYIIGQSFYLKMRKNDDLTENLGANFSTAFAENVLLLRNLLLQQK